MNGIKWLPSAFTAVTALVAGPALTFVGVADAAQTSPRLDHLMLPAAKPTPPPPRTRARSHKWGVSIGAHQSNRYESKTVPGRKVASGTKSTNPRTSLRQSSTKPGTDRTQPFRLNISLCGFQGGNTPQLTRCLPALEEDRPDRPNQPSVTPSMAVAIRIPRPEDVAWTQVLEEVRNVAFPGLSVKVQPAGRTLVNLDTIVYTDESKVSTATVMLLGFPVIVEATPMSYTWHFGDGASVTTTTPGRPYPAKDITHKYMKKGGVGLSLTTHYAARFNVAGTGWQYVDGLVPITGPATVLQVREAVPVLVEPGR